MCFAPFRVRFLLPCLFAFSFSFAIAGETGLTLNEQEYFEMPGLNVMVFHDFYPEGHQGGISIIQNGVRVATNGDVRLEPTPGQWQPVPKLGERVVDREKQSARVTGAYPDSSKHAKGFNPIFYPDLAFAYMVTVKAEGKAVRVTVNLEEALPQEWIGKVGFNLELFPGEYFGRTFYMDGKPGLFPRQLNGPMRAEQGRDLEVQPLAVGQTLVVAPEVNALRMNISSRRGELQLLDGRAHHNNGWFVVRTAIPPGATSNAIDWLIEPHAIPDWTYDPVVHVSQVGYHPDQQKVAVIETDPAAKPEKTVVLKRITPSGTDEVALSKTPEPWGRFVRYQYYTFDFSEIKQPGIYQVEYGGRKTEPFQISDSVYERHVWQPTLEYFLPVQMCHMRVNDRYRVWHGLCHMDDALMAPANKQHFDGYLQGTSTLTRYVGEEHVPGLNVGGWHDAGDYDLRVESQAGTVRILSLAYEAFAIDYDETTVNQKDHIVELHRPDGKPDILQQIEHGVLSIIAGYENLGRLYRGIICPDLRQYVLLGDGSTMTDNQAGKGRFDGTEPDDRMVFTEENPRRELFVASCIASVSRVLGEYNPQLSRKCLQVAEAIWQADKDAITRKSGKIEPAAELYLTTGKKEYRQALIDLLPEIERTIGRIGWVLGRVLPKIDDTGFSKAVTEAVHADYARLTESLKENPFGVPYRPHIWGAGWDIQAYGFRQYYLHKGWPDIVPERHMLDALNFVLGKHPGPNTSSFASGVGSKSLLVAYGTNRHEWSYIPGGVASGTAYIRPDFPELKEWPYFWQQTEYVMGGGGSNFLFLVLAARQVLE